MPIDAFRCDLTPERLDIGERELAAALSLAATRTQESVRRAREGLEPRLRVLGLAACTLGTLVSGWAAHIAGGVSAYGSLEVNVRAPRPAGAGKHSEPAAARLGRPGPPIAGALVPRLECAQGTGRRRCPRRLLGRD